MIRSPIFDPNQPGPSYVNVNQEINHQEEEEDYDNDDDNGNILSIHYSDHRLGFAYYSTKRNRLFLFEDYHEVTSDFSIIDKIVIQVMPKSIIISARLDTRVKDRLLFAVEQLIPPDNDEKIGEQEEEQNDDNDNTDQVYRSKQNVNQPVNTPVETPVTNAANTRLTIGNNNNSNNGQASINGDDSISNNDINNVFGDRFNDTDSCLNGDQLPCLPSTIKIKQASDFSHDEALAKVFQLELPNTPIFDDPRLKFMFLSSLINFKDEVTLQALGALIKEIENFNLIADGDGQKIVVNGISPCTLESLVFLDAQSKLALQIFAVENHPSVYKQGNSRKEGLSLFALFNRCSSRIGSRYLKQIFNQPTNNMTELSDRLDMVEYFVKTPSMAEALKSCLKGVQDPNSIIVKMRFADCSINDWSKLLKIIKKVCQVNDYLRNVQTKFNIAAKFVQLFTSSQLTIIVDLIETVVDFKQSRATGRFEVNKGLDNELDEIKSLYDQLPDIMFQQGTQEFLRYQDRISSCQITYTTHLGFFLKVPISSEQMLSNNFKIPGLEFRYRVGESGYYKSPVVRELDSTFGDILTEIVERQRKIQIQLQFKVLEKIDALDDLTQLCAKIDAYIAIAETSRCFKYKRPTFNPNDEIDIEGGRHPLQEIFVNSYITNDCKTGNQPGKIQIITGPNASGKSVLLKQVCLIVYMAHIGSFVPAQYANITLMERILTRIKTVESMSFGLSSFILDLKQVALMAREPTNHSLVAIDEFGKGTDPISGIALLSALINYFASASHVPHVFVATHFLTIDEYIGQSNHISFWTLDVSLEADEVIYKYKLIPGKTSSSRAMLVIKAAGLADLLLERTAEIEEQLRKGLKISPRPIVPLQTRAQKLLRIADKFEITDFDHDGFDGEDFLKELASL